MKMKFLFTIFLCFFVSVLVAQTTKNYHVKSPDGKIDLSITTGDKIEWSVKHEDTEIITPSAISMTLQSGEVLGKLPVVKNTKTASADQYFNTPIYKKDKVHDQYNQLTSALKAITR
jgi:alpha-glucosidase